MTMAKARQAVRDSREEIFRQIDLLADQAGVDRLTMTRALQEGLSQELGNDNDADEEENTEFTARLNIAATRVVQVTTYDELDEEVAHLESELASLCLDDIQVTYEEV